ncbi:hypothetical protein GT347_07535 [Xylophilus rhododendri]|uniref:Uncharacterized protein n=1 Tax=Xylophilus rhododendri TaxID=2697032 RepID=A0A857J2J1_9BURK|nr:hypothetical protein [Xylophilus rhododendri]QHI97857.1 hypothetical protein GT347_07535 [Xylophilus rhododendri]
MQISPVDRSIAVVVKADGAGATASGTSSQAETAKAAAEPLRAGVTHPSSEKSDYLTVSNGAKTADTPSADASNSDWASTAKAAAEKKEKEKEAIKPPLYQLLIDQFNSLWRASAQAVDATTQAQALAQATKQSQQDANGKSAPLVYTDPSKVRKTGSTEGA